MPQDIPPNPTEIFDEALREHQETKSPPEPEVPAEPPVEEAVAQDPPVAEEQATEEDQKSSQFSDFLKSKGYDVSKFGEDDDAILRNLESLAAQADSIREYSSLIEKGREYSQHERDFQDFLAGKAQPKSEPASEEQESHESFGSWQPPEYDPRWEDLCEYSPKLGRFVLSEDAKGTVPHEVADKLTQYKVWQHNMSNRIVHEFPTLVQEIIQPLLEERFKQVQEFVPQQFAQTQAQQQQEARLNQILESHKADWYLLDESGELSLDAAGNPILTPVGQKVRGYVEYANQLGITDPINQLEYAVSLTGAPVGESTEEAVPEATPSQRNEAQKKNFVKRAKRDAAGHAPNRDNSIKEAARNGMPQNSQTLDFSSMVDQAMKESGFNI